MTDEQIISIDSDRENAGSTWLNRRGFLQFGLFSVTAVVVVTITGVTTRFLIGDAFRVDDGQWVPLAAISELPPGQMHKVTYSLNATDAWRRIKQTGTLYAFSENGELHTILDATCTHLGCLVRWQQEDNQFRCPCHEGIFTKQGEVVSGAPSKPLPQLKAEINDGVLFAFV